MQALILAGGRGVRLQPLTITTPKPLVPLANRPLVEHIVRWLEQSGIDRVWLLTQYRATDFDHWLRRWQGVPVQAVEELTPLGTAGAVANVAHLLRGTTAVINGDNLTNLDLAAMAHFHKSRGAIATIATDRVDDPTGRGVVVADASGRVTAFQEKPVYGSALARTVNTGSYLVEPAAIANLAPGTRAMWETDIFPALIGAGAPVYAFETPHLWLDAGTPSGYFAAQAAILSRSASTPAGLESDGIWAEANTSRDAGAHYQPPIALGFGAVVAAGARLLGPLSIGRECHVLPGALLEHSAIWDNCFVEAGARVVDSIVGYNCYIAANALVEGALLGDGVIVRAGAHVPAGARVAPGTVIEATATPRGYPAMPVSTG